MNRHLISIVLLLAPSALLVLPSSAPGQSGPELLRAADKVTPENSVLQDSCTLFFAAAKAFKERRIEDAAFYFYAARIRAAADMEAYAPVGEGGNSPGVAISALLATIGPRINPSIMRDREAFGRVVARVEEWEPQYSNEYQPGWEYKVALRGPALAKAISEAKQPAVTFLDTLNQLFQIDDYYDAVKIVQDYNLAGSGAFQAAVPEGPPAAAPARPSKQQFAAAMKRLKQIETERGLKSGLFPHKEELKRARKPEYSVTESGVTFQKQPVEGADPHTFQVLSDVDYGKDANQVYVRGYAIRGADPQTFRVLESPYARDASKLYCGNIEMHVGRIEDFEVIESSTMWEVCFDKRGILGSFGDAFETLDVDRNSPAVFGQVWGRDGKFYYYGPAAVDGADYASFKVIDGTYAEDKNREYMGRRPMEKGSIPAWVRDHQQ